jgi:hypothetical protein
MDVSCQAYPNGYVQIINRNLLPTLRIRVTVLSASTTQTSQTACAFVCEYPLICALRPLDSGLVTHAKPIVYKNAAAAVITPSSQSLFPLAPREMKLPQGNQATPPGCVLTAVPADSATPHTPAACE